MDRQKILFACTLTFSIILEFCVRYYDWWSWFGEQMDSVMHFWWGFNIFLAFIIFFKWTPIDALLGVFVWQMIWEAIEIVGDRVITQVAMMLDPFYYDGIKDTVVDILGGLAAWGALMILRTDLLALRQSPIGRWMRTFSYAMLPGMVIGAIITWRMNESASIFFVVWACCAAAATAIWVKMSARSTTKT